MSAEMNSVVTAARGPARGRAPVPDRRRAQRAARPGRRGSGGRHPGVRPDRRGDRYRRPGGGFADLCGRALRLGHHPPARARVYQGHLLRGLRPGARAVAGRPGHPQAACGRAHLPPAVRHGVPRGQRRGAASGPAPGNSPGTRRRRPPGAAIRSSAAGEARRARAAHASRGGHARPTPSGPAVAWPGSRPARSGARRHRVSGPRRARPGPDGRRGQPGGDQPRGRAAQGLAVPPSRGRRPGGSRRDARQRPARPDARWRPVLHRLGFPDVPSYLRERHVRQHRTVNAMAAEIGVTHHAIESALRRHGLDQVAHVGTRHAAGERAAQVAAGLGYDTIGRYLRERRAAGWTWRAMAAESGQPESWLRRQAARNTGTGTPGRAGAGPLIRAPRPSPV